MTNSKKLRKAISTLKDNVNYTNHNPIVDTEEMFNKILWVNGENESSTIPSGLSWTAVKAEMDKL
tara:strand:- start:13 stop:207 length:195 start_codon:yes stop_codon:yes gene_type:complete